MELKSRAAGKYFQTILWMFDAIQAIVAILPLTIDVGHTSMAAKASASFAGIPHAPVLTKASLKICPNQLAGRASARGTALRQR